MTYATTTSTGVQTVQTSAATPAPVVTTTAAATAATTAKPVTTTAAPTTTKPVTTTQAVTTQPPSNSGTLLAWPAPGYYRISSPFGWRTLGGVSKLHKGIDIIGSTNALKGANACAAASGKVITVKTGCGHNNSSMCGCNGGYGNYIQIDHGNGIVTLYAHLQAVNVSVGQRSSTRRIISRNYPFCGCIQIQRTEQQSAKRQETHVFLAVLCHAIRKVRQQT